MSTKTATARLVNEFRSRPTPRAGSLIITVFGDAIQPRGGSVWVGSLIKALADFGISERLVRTSVYRLTHDAWLHIEQLGRRSFYNLTDSGAQKFAQATSRIYADPGQPWDGQWCLVLLAGLPGEQKDLLRKELGWCGFAAISSSVLAHPAPAIAALESTLEQLGVSKKLVVFEGRTLGAKQDDAMRVLVHKSWNLKDLDQRYAAFLRQYNPVLKALNNSCDCDFRLAFQIRTLLIQEYRKILLRDPLLPTELLPKAWHGAAAYELCRELYQRVFQSADEFLTQEFETANGPLPLPAASFYDRFGGLKV